MPNKTGTIHIKWKRSGIGFSRKQKEIVRSIGLHRLNQVVESPDTAQFHGLVAKVAHLVEVVDSPAVPEWTKIPEYKIIPAEPKRAVSARKQPVDEPSAGAAADTNIQSAAPAKKSAAAKSREASPSPSETTNGSEKPKRKAAPTKAAASAKRRSKSEKGKK
ncbi:MAG TPA: 50S ribosomal protein L30 [Terriglobia bacterium]|nr:50S ribosomal protein L30 [Terriglobia bacterium]